MPKEERLARYQELYERGGFALWLGNYSDSFMSQQAADEIAEFLATKIRARVTDPALAEKPIPQHPFGTITRCAESNVEWIVAGLRYTNPENVRGRFLLFAGVPLYREMFADAAAKGYEGFDLRSSSPRPEGLPPSRNDRINLRRGYSACPSRT